MKLQHPKTGDIFEVSDEHGEMLLNKGFYTEAPIEKEIVVAEETTYVAPKPTKKKTIKRGE